MQNLDGKVVVITGAAHGLGRCHALHFAKLGARIVVNDLGTTLDGKGRDESAARAVVEEIEKAGGQAVPHFGDVADFGVAQSLVKSAVDAFGSLDVMILNAGFTRDAVLFNLSEEDFDAVVRVHLKGHFAPMKFAALYWREKGKAQGGPVFGRLLSTASESYLFGTPGQPNYAAAKAGIVSMTMGAAKLLLKYGVTANVVMPRARTRMTLATPQNAAIFQKPAEGFDHFAPENSTPLFAYLCTPQAQHITANVFIVWGKQVQVLARPAKAASFDSDTAWNLENLHQHLGPWFEKKQPIVDGFPLPEI